MPWTIVEQANSASKRGRHLEAAELFEQAADAMGDRHPFRRRVLGWARSARNQAVLVRVKASEIQVLPRLEDWIDFRDFPQ